MCDMSKSVGITMHDYFVPLFSTEVVTVDAASTSFQVDMSLFLDEQMVQPIGQNHQSKPLT